MELDVIYSGDEISEKDTNDNVDVTPVKKRQTKRYLGLVFAMLSSILFAFNGIFVKLSKTPHKVQVSVILFAVEYLSLLPVLTKRKEKIIPSHCPTFIFLLLRGILGSTALICIMMSYAFIDVGDSLAITNSNTVFVGIFACVFLKEPCKILDIVVTMFTLVGVVFIAQPPFIFGGNSSSGIVGVALAVSASVFSASAFVTVRKLGSKIHFSHSLFYFAWVGTVSSVVFMIVTSQTTLPCAMSLVYMFIAGVFIFFGQICMTLALQNERAGPCTLIKTSQAGFAFILEYLVFGIVPTVFTVIGSVLIFLCALVLIVRNIRKPV